MGFDTRISDVFVKMRVSTILQDVVRLHQCTKTPLKYVYTSSKYGNSFAIPDSSTQESFSISARDKGWDDKILLHFSVGNEEHKVAMEQYLSKYIFEKYEYE